jgi:hypothetical protein
MLDLLQESYKRPIDQSGRTSVYKLVTSETNYLPNLGGTTSEYTIVALKPQAARNKQNNRIKTLPALLGQSSAHPKPPEYQSFLLHRCQQLPTETLKNQKPDLTTESTAEQPVINGF